jgi:methionyl-tRNA formyltransferase
MNGDSITGITIMKMEAGLDSGPILLQQATAIGPDDTAGDIFDILARQGGDLMVSALRIVAEGRAAFTPQSDGLATYARKITAQDQLIEWDLPSSLLHDMIRGLSPSPGAKATLVLDGRAPLPLRIEPGIPLAEDTGEKPGTLAYMSEKGLVVACGKGSYCVTRLRPAGRPTMNASDFRNGHLKGLAAPYGAFEIH